MYIILLVAILLIAPAICFATAMGAATTTIGSQHRTVG